MDTPLDTELRGRVRLARDHAPIKVLVVDDSAIVRKLLMDGLRADAGIEVVGSATDPFVARDMILRLEPDVLTLDIEMPRMDGLSFLRRLMAHHPMPVIVVSSLTPAGSVASIEALRAGAIDVLPKPGGPHSVGQVIDRLRERILGIRDVIPARLARQNAPGDQLERQLTFGNVRKLNGLIAIGASTGGPQAIEALLTRLPSETPPLVIVQHMPAHFTRTYAERLNRVCPMRVTEAEDRQVLERGVAYIAPGDKHLLIDRDGIRLLTRLSDGAPVHHQRPAVDVTFHSIARLRGLSVVALLLTGMGQDGADGMLALRQAGAETIAEDEHSCVVFGMPREAIQRGAAVHVATLLRMPGLISECFAELARRSPSAVA